MKTITKNYRNSNMSSSVEEIVTEKEGYTKRMVGLAHSLIWAGVVMVICLIIYASIKIKACGC